MKFTLLIATLLAMVTFVSATDYASFAPDFNDIVYNFQNYAFNFIRQNGGNTNYNAFISIWNSTVEPYLEADWVQYAALLGGAGGNLLFVSITQGGFNQVAILAKTLKDTFADQALGGGQTLYGVLD